MIQDKLNQAAIRAYKHVATNWWTFGPRALLVETTKTCNLRCPGCRRNYAEGSIYTEPGPIHLTLPMLSRAVEGIRPSYVRFEGDGEPTANPHLRELLRGCKRLGLRSMMTSNGTLLTDDYINFLQDAGMTRIHVSFDGATKETYEATKLGADYEKVLYNCKMIGLSKIQLFMNVVLFSDSIVDELPAYVEQAKKVGATGIHYMKMQQDQLGFGKPPHMSLHSRTIKLFNHLTKKAGLMVVGTCSDEPTFIPCYDPFMNPFVLLNGDVYACTYLANLRRTDVYEGVTLNVPYIDYCMGNLYNDSMKEIWFGEAYGSLRRQLKTLRERTGYHTTPKELLARKLTAAIDQQKFPFAFCASCSCQWGESGL